MIRTFVQQAFKERVDPIEALLKDKVKKLQEVITLADKNEGEITRLDGHYDDVCKAILKTNGIQIRDLNSHNIFGEF
jgi:tRNA U34 2-thiouridine synthase MnmA/TrmU